MVSKKEKVIGRKLEQSVLELVYSSKKPEFLAIYGRRRVGKTFLIRSFFKKKTCLFFNSTGIHKQPMALQIQQFTKEIGRVFYQGTELKEKKNWFETFELLLEAIQKQTPHEKKIVLFFDEFPWMATHKSHLLQALEFYWNRHLSQDHRIKLIICGSSASWIIRNIVNNKGGLHNRLTRTIHLEPLSLKETKDFLNYLNIKLNLKHISQIYMVTGGVPYYLSYINKAGSSAQIIENMVFVKDSFFIKEFENLYSSLFDDAETYIELIRIIAHARYGLSQEEIFQASEGTTKGGSAVDKLRDLENAGFILSFKPYQHQKKGIYYRVIDEYTLFYFKWIEPIKQTLLTKGIRVGYWQSVQNSPSWHAWAGYSFESVCYKHLSQISESLALSPASIPSAWRYSPTKGSREQGAQIDLLFDRNDDAITICEIKYSAQPFGIDKSYAEKLKQKIEVFRKITRTNKQIFLAMITSNGLKNSIYSEELVTGQVTLDDLFF
jgi:uncharacterized protein